MLTCEASTKTRSEGFPAYLRLLKHTSGRCLGLAGLAVLLAAGQGSAQDAARPRDLIGTVTDHGSREPLKGAVVILENQSSKAITSYLADAGGNYTFKRLRNDTDYLVWARYRGKESKQSELSHFDSNQHPVIHLVIELN